MEITTKLVIFGAGVFAGYMLFDYMTKTKKTKIKSTPKNVECPASINCMPTTEGGTMHPYCTNMPEECVGITSKAV